MHQAAVAVLPPMDLPCWLLLAGTSKPVVARAACGEIWRRFAGISAWRQKYGRREEIYIIRRMRFTNENIWREGSPGWPCGGVTGQCNAEAINASKSENGHVRTGNGSVWQK